MKSVISLAVVAAIGVSFVGCKDEEPGVKATAVEFMGMSAPSSEAQMSTAYSDATVRVYTSESDYEDYPLSYETLFNVKDKVGNNPYQAGQIYNAKMEPVMDPFGAPVLAETPDANSLLNVDGKLFLVSHLEYDWILSDGTKAYKKEGWYSRMPMSMLLTTIKQKKDGKLVAKKQRPIDFSSVDGIWIPCFGSQTPWNTHLGSEEDYDLYYYSATGTQGSRTEAGTKALSEVYFSGEKTVNPYHYGYITEVEVKRNAKTEITKHYSMGKGTWEMSKIMPDGKTAYFGDDGSNVGMFMYVADKENDISSGTLYAAKWTQTSPVGATDGGSANLSWIKLGHNSDAQVKLYADQFSFSEIFNTTDVPTPGFKAIKAGQTSVEYVQLKPGMEAVAAALEPRRYAAYLGATTEWNKMEGIAVNKKDKKLYMAMSYIDKGMKEDSSFGTDDIKIAKNNCGGTYELTLDGNQKDSDNNLIDSEYVATSMHVPAALLGEEIATDANGNTCHVDKVANTDNVFFSDKMRTLFIGEDSGTHTNNFLWAYNVDTQKLSRLLSLPAGAESTGLQVVENENGHAYIMSNAQHLGDFTKTTPDALKTALEPNIDKFNAPFGYINGIPGLR
ncbi:MAG TPA: DUF839 domain-containing protein [Helicobacteraceae bacterium]|nr:DUF839 domain-containing protein [Helicobacteraceae bacterium]